MDRKRITKVVPVEQPVQEARYRNVPLDQITHKKLMSLCEARGFGQRGQGALVRILINKAYEETVKPDGKK